MRNSKKSYMFEPGDSLRKIAAEEFKAGSAFEAKEKIKKLILESVGNTRHQVKVDVNMIFQDISSTSNSYGNNSNYGNVDLKNFDAIAKLSVSGTNEKKTNTSMSIPVMVREGKLNPIDTAELMGHTFVFSPKFLEKALEAMAQINKNPYALDRDSSFAAVEDRVSPLSDDGRIRDVLQIRNKDTSGMNTMMADAPILRRASEALDEFLEKTSKVTEFKTIEPIIKAQAYKIAEELIFNQFEKSASLTEDIGERIMQSASIFTKLKEMPWKKVMEVADKAVVEIVDVDIESENLKLKNAVVFKGISSFAGASYDEEGNDSSFLISPSSGLAIIDEDKNYKILKPSTDMAKKYLVADTAPSFKLKAESLKTLMARTPRDHNKLYFLFMENGLLGPVGLTTPFDEDEMYFANSASTQYRDRVGKVATQCVRIMNKDTSFSPPKRGHAAVFVLEKGIKGFKEINDDERQAILSNLFQNASYIRYTMEHANLIGEDTLVLEVKDFIRTPVESLTDIIFGFKSNDKPLAKIASEDRVTVEKPIPDVNKYNVVLSKGMLNKKTFKALRRDEVVGLLKSVGVEESDAVSMVGYLDSGEKTISRPAVIDFGKIDGSLVESKATDIVKNFAGQMFGRPQQEELLKEVVSSQLANMLVNAPSGVFNAASTLSSYASDAEALSDRFEKLAVDLRSREFQELAKCCVATARMDRLMEKVATQATALDLRESRKALKETLPAIEKCASMLYDLRVSQREGAQMVGENTITQALQTLQRLYTYGSH